MSAGVEQLERERDELAELLELRDRLSDPKTELRLHEVTNALLVREQQDKNERAVALREYEQAIGAYTSARNDALAAIEASTDTMKRARAVRATLDGAYKRCERLGVSPADMPVMPLPARLLGRQDNGVREIFEAARIAATTDF